MQTTLNAPFSGNKYVSAKNEFITQVVSGLSTDITGVKVANTDAESDEYQRWIGLSREARGRDLYYPFISSGRGRGPYIELADGSVKLDLVNGMGVHFFGYAHPEIIETQLDALCGVITYGNLGPSKAQILLTKKILDAVPKTRLKHGWVTTCGAMANENALKIIRQKKHPRSKIIAFRGSFAGRTTALQEITDNESYRRDQPLYGIVDYIPFFDQFHPKGPAEQALGAIQELEKLVLKEQYAGFFTEIVQGEGGLTSAPQEFLEPILKRAKELGLYVWIDEVQTFGRTGELFAFQKLGLDHYVDIVTAAKALQVGVTLWCEDLNPKLGLISGTFASSATSVAAALKILELLISSCVGPKGRVTRLAKAASQEIGRIKTGKYGKLLKDYNVFGGMIGLTLFDGSMENTRRFLLNLWDLGVIAYYCGHGPYRVRLLPPFGIMNEDELLLSFNLIEKAIAMTATQIGNRAE